MVKALKMMSWTCRATGLGKEAEGILAQLSRSLKSKQINKNAIARHVCGGRMKRGVAYIKIDMQNLSCKFCLLVFNAIHLGGVIKFIKPEQNKKEG